MLFVQKCMFYALVAVAMSSPGCQWVGKPKNPVTVKEVEDKVRKGVPLGSSRTEVETWLKSQGIVYGYHDELKYASSVRDSGLEPSALSGVVEAIIRDTDRSFMIEGNICISFFLDKNGKTVKHMVKWVGTGP